MTGRRDDVEWLAMMINEIGRHLHMANEMMQELHTVIVVGEEPEDTE